VTDIDTDTGAIRDALAAIAEEAPAAERVRSTLTDRARAHRHRRVLLTAGALVTAGAATGFTGYVAVRERRGTRPAGPPGDPVRVPHTGPLRVPYAHHPAWLPDGVGLDQLGAVVEGGEVRLVTRRWRAPGRDDGPLGPAVELVIGDHWLGGTGPYDGAKSFDINGAEGKLKIRAFRLPADPGRPAEVDRAGDLRWDPPDAPPLRVGYTGDGSYDDDDPAVRVARSVRPDPRWFPLRPGFGWLPERFAGGALQVRFGVRAQGWYQEVTAYPRGGRDGSGAPPRGITLEIGTAGQHGFPAFPPPRPQQVRGLDGRYLRGYLQFTLPDGNDVLIYGLDAPDEGPPPPDLLRVAEEFDFGDWPDMSWAGTR
jgi:hypothetical protein